jgi:hypothetical protein
MQYHIDISIKQALDMLYGGENIFSSSREDAIRALLQADGEGKTYYSGCDNVDSTGRCLGHNQ